MPISVKDEEKHGLVTSQYDVNVIKSNWPVVDLVFLDGPRSHVASLGSKTEMDWSQVSAVIRYEIWELNWPVIKHSILEAHHNIVMLVNAGAWTHNIS